MTDIVVTTDDAVKFLEEAARNWNHAPRLARDDVEDVRVALTSFAARHRQSAVEEVERLRAMLVRMIEAMELDGDPAYAHLIMDARRALTGDQP